MSKTKRFKSKRQLVPPLSEDQNLRACGGVEVKFHAVLTLVLDANEWPGYSSGHCGPTGNVTATHWTDWADPKSSLVDAMEKLNICGPDGN